MDVQLQLSLLTAQVEQLASNIKVLTDATLLARKTWLPPAEFAELSKISPVTLREKRRSGVFREQSLRSHHRGKRTDFTYHRDFALEDLERGGQIK